MIFIDILFTEHYVAMNTNGCFHLSAITHSTSNSEINIFVSASLCKYRGSDIADL